MTQLPTLDELVAQHRSQNEDLAAAAHVAAATPGEFVLDEGFTSAFEELTELPTAAVASVPLFGIRA